jgi:hypothetical protein
MNPHNNTHHIYENGAKNIPWRKTASSTHVAGSCGYLSVKTETKSTSITLY